VANSKKQGRPKSEEKYQLILRAASWLFLKEGVANTSMDKVAKVSGVSKQTVYSHFENKDALFKAAISSKCKRYQPDPKLLTAVTSGSLSLLECLQKIGCQFVRLLQDPEVIAMFRVIIAESRNSSHVATLFYQAGPEAWLSSLGDVISNFGRGRLSHELANQIATDYCALLKGTHHIMMLCGLHPPLSEEKMSAHVKSAAEKTVLLFEHHIRNQGTNSINH